MKLKFQEKKPFRFKNQYMWIEHTYTNVVMPTSGRWMYNIADKEWQFITSFSYFYERRHILREVEVCHSVRAFRRKLKKMPADVFTLYNRFSGNKIEGIGKLNYRKLQDD